MAGRGNLNIPGSKWGERKSRDKRVLGKMSQDITGQ